MFVEDGFLFDVFVALWLLKLEIFERDFLLAGVSCFQRIFGFGEVLLDDAEVVLVLSVG